jgi:glycosyltransferase involved in cell wall biosynthesis
MNKATKFIVMMGTSPMAQGGIATVVANYEQCGLLRRWDVKYLTTHTSGSKRTKLISAVLALLQLLGLLFARRVSVVHLHMSSRASTWRKWIYTLAARAFGVPYMIHLHSPDYVDFFDKECGLVQRHFIRKLFTRAKYVIALSKSWANDILRIAPDSNVVVLFNSVDLPVLDCLPAESQASRNQARPVILFLGRIGERKGAFDLLKAASLVNIDFELIMAGDGEISEAKALAKSLRICDQISFPGWLRGQEKNSALSRARVFALPSHNEGVPMAILEAMSWGIPVVTTPVGGIPEVVLNNVHGLLVSPGNVSELAAALSELLSKPETARQMGDAGRCRVKDTFAHDILIPRLEQLWKEAGASIAPEKHDQV